MPKSPKPVDRRIAKSRQAMRDALLALLARKSWDEISVRELCDQANVGRSTFYLRYQCKEDLLAEGLDDLRDVLAQSPGQPGGGGFAFVPGLLAHVSEQRAVFRSVIGRRSGQGVVNRFKDMVRQLVELEFQRRGRPLTHPWLARYLAAGMVEAIAWWVDAPKPPGLQHMADRLDALAASALALR